MKAMNIEDKLPKAEDILKSKYNAFKESGLPFTSDTGLKWQLDAMHEYARRLLDIVAESAETKTIWHSDIANEVDQIIVDKQSILKLKEMLK